MAWRCPRPLGCCSLTGKGCQPLLSKPSPAPCRQPPEQRAFSAVPCPSRTPVPQAGLLEVDLRALALGGEAGNGPHLDLNARVKLLVPHVPDALDGGGNRFILQMARCLE